MKKLVIVFAVGLFAACSNGETMSSTDTSSARSSDTSVRRDTSMMKNDTSMMRKDTSSMPQRDTTKM